MDPLVYCRNNHLKNDSSLCLRFCAYCNKAMCDTCFDTHKNHCSGQLNSCMTSVMDARPLTAPGQPPTKKIRDNHYPSLNDDIDTLQSLHSCGKIESFPSETKQNVDGTHPICSTHSRHQEMVCFTHFELLCQECQNWHPTCNVKFVSDVCKELDHTIVIEYRKWLNKLRLDSIEIKQLMSRNIDSLEKQKLSALNELKGEISKAKESLDKAFVDEKSGIEDKHSSHTAELCDKICHIDGIIKQLDQSLNDSKFLEGSKMEENVFLKLLEIITKYKNADLPGELKKTVDNLTRTKMSFKRNKRFQPLSPCSAFGKTDIDITKVTSINSNSYSSLITILTSKSTVSENVHGKFANRRLNVSKTEDCHVQSATNKNMVEQSVPEIDNTDGKEFVAEATGIFIKSNLINHGLDASCETARNQTNKAYLSQPGLNTLTSDKDTLKIEENRIVVFEGRPFTLVPYKIKTGGGETGQLKGGQCSDETRSKDSSVFVEMSVTEGDGHHITIGRNKESSNCIPDAVRWSDVDGKRNFIKTTNNAVIMYPDRKSHEGTHSDSNLANGQDKFNGISELVPNTMAQGSLSALNKFQNISSESEVMPKSRARISFSTLNKVQNVSSDSVVMPRSIAHSSFDALDKVQNSSSGIEVMQSAIVQGSFSALNKVLNASSDTTSRQNELKLKPSLKAVSSITDTSDSVETPQYLGSTPGVYRDEIIDSRTGITDMSNQHTILNTPYGLQTDRAQRQLMPRPETKLSLDRVGSSVCSLQAKRVTTDIALNGENSELLKSNHSGNSNIETTLHDTTSVAGRGHDALLSTENFEIRDSKTDLLQSPVGLRRHSSQRQTNKQNDITKIKAEKTSDLHLENDDDINWAFIDDIDVTRDGRICMVDTINDMFILITDDTLRMLSLQLSDDSTLTIHSTSTAVVDGRHKLLFIDISGSELRLQETIDVDYDISRISSNGKHLFVLAYNKNVYKINNSGDIIWSFEGSHWFCDIACTRDQDQCKVILSNFEKNTIFVIDADSGNVIKRHKLNGKLPVYVTSDDNGNIFVFIGKTKQIVVWDKNMTRRSRILTTIDFLPRSLAFDASRKQLLVLHWQGISRYQLTYA